ncbi:transglycosylase, partial [Mycolicibacterium smegmatis]
IVDASLQVPADVPPAPPAGPAPVDAVAAPENQNWDQAPAPADQPQTWALHVGGPLPLDPVLPDPAPAPAPAPAPGAPAAVAAPAPDPLAPAPNADVAPAPPEGVPHLASPENLPPGTTETPDQIPGQGPNMTYLREIWHAIQTQDISGKDALLALTQRPLTTPDVPGGAAPNRPVAPPPAPGDPALAPAPAPLGAPAPAPAPEPAPVGARAAVGAPVPPPA